MLAQIIGMLKNSSNRGIQFKFLSVMSCILLIGTIVTSLFIVINDRKVQKDSLAAMGTSLASFIGKLSKEPMLIQNRMGLDEIVNDANKNEYVAYAVIKDNQGASLTSLYASINYYLPAVKTVLMDSPGVNTVLDIVKVINGKGAVLEVSSPIVIRSKETTDQIVGTVTIGMSEGKMYQQMIKTIVFVVMLNLVIAFLLMGMMFIVSKRIIFGPIIELAHAASRFARGDGLTGVKIKATGEVKALVDSFNDMVENLDRVTVSKDYMNNIIKSMSNTLIVVSAENIITNVNAAACILLGYEEDELIGQSAEMVFSGGKTRQNSWIKTLLTVGHITNVDEVFKAKDGHEVSILLSASIIRDPNNLVRGIVQVAQDISERKRREGYREMVREVLQILNAPGLLLDSIQRVIDVLKMRIGLDAVGIRLQDGEDFPYFAQQGFPQDFYLMENTLIGRTMNGEVCRDNNGKVRLACTCGLVIEGRADPTSPHFTPGGSFWINDSLQLLNIPASEDPRFQPRDQCIHCGYASFALVPIWNKEKIVGLIHLSDKRKDQFTLDLVEILEGIASHIGTAMMRHQAEDGMRDVMETLERRVQERNLELEKVHTEMVLQEKMASVGQLAAGIAHEINTPMQFVGSNMEFFEEANLGISLVAQSLQQIIATAPTEIAQKLQSALDEADWEYLIEEMPSAIKQSKDGISRVISIVRAMKEFSHPSSGAKENVVVNSIIEKTVLISRNEWKYVANLTTDLAVDLPPVPCYVDKLGQVFLNLIINAAQAIGEKLGRNPEGGKGDIRISTKVVDSFIEIRIQDTGPGIPVEICGRIFDPFFTTKEVGRGTGQGLAISHDVIAVKHGGILTFETEEGKGSTFIVRLPITG